jgi:hypothetical protein
MGKGRGEESGGGEGGHFTILGLGLDFHFRMAVIFKKVN